MKFSLALSTLALLFNQASAVAVQTIDFKQDQVATLYNRFEGKTLTLQSITSNQFFVEKSEDQLGLTNSNKPQWKILKAKDNSHYFQVNGKNLLRDTSGNIFLEKKGNPRIMKVFVKKVKDFRKNNPRYHFCYVLGKLQCISAETLKYTADESKWTSFAIKSN